MTDSGRGPKEERPRSSKPQSRTSQAPTSTSRSRPTSDVHGTTSKSRKHQSAPSRPRGEANPIPRSAGTADGASRMSKASIEQPPLLRETFLLRPSIDQPAPPLTATEDLDENHEDETVAGNDEVSYVNTVSHTNDDTFPEPSPTKPLIHIMGAPGSGKSTFVAQYFKDDGSENSVPGISSVYPKSNVMFHESTFDGVDVLDNGRIRWSKLPQNFQNANVNGAVVLYDVTNRSSLNGIQRIIKALSDSSIPTAVVASKSDAPFDSQDLEPDAIEERIKHRFEDIRVYRMSRRSPDNVRTCVSTLLGGSGSVQDSTARRETAFRPDASPASPRSPIRLQTTSLVMRPSADELDIDETTSGVVRTSRAGPGSLGVEGQESSQAQLEAAVEDRASHSFLNLEDSPRLELRSTEAPSGSEVGKRRQTIQPGDALSPIDSALTFDELMPRLLYPGSSKNRMHFVATFLTFYRFFAPPLRLLEAVIRHFDAHDANIIHPWVNELTLEHDLSVIDRWITSFPGDFSKLAVRQKLRKFLSRVAQDHGLGSTEDSSVVGDTTGRLVTKNGEAAKIAASASQILLALDFVDDDDDTNWACSDSGPHRHSRNNNFLSISSLDSYGDGNGTEKPLSKVSSTNPAYDAKLIFGGQSTLTLTAIGRSRTDRSLSTKSPLNIAESAQRQATLLCPNPTQPFGKSQWRLFINFADDQIARELTRIDWIMFSSIRPRDLIRHVTVPTAERDRFKSLENVTRMTEHFNHVAFWVTNVILFRDKPKHRAQALEKFMRIARKLRELNNYNSLGAVIAGVQSTAIHRLKATKDLVNTAAQKDFMKLEILMSTTKGYTSYRLAWENTTSERIPFLPLHRRELVMADAGGKTFVPDNPQSTSVIPDDTDGQLPSNPQDSSVASNAELTPAASPQSDPAARINWRKFALMGDIIHNLTLAQSLPYVGFTANEAIRSLLLDHKIVKDEDDLYERSTALEPSANSVGGAPLSLTSSRGQGDVRKKKVIDRMAELVG